MINCNVVQLKGKPTFTFQVQADCRFIICKQRKLNKNTWIHFSENFTQILCVCKISFKTVAFSKNSTPRMHKRRHLGHVNKIRLFKDTFIQMMGNSANQMEVDLIQLKNFSFTTVQQFNTWKGLTKTWTLIIIIKIDYFWKDLHRNRMPTFKLLPKFS